MRFKCGPWMEKQEFLSNSNEQRADKIDCKSFYLIKENVIANEQPRSFHRKAH